MKERAQDFRLLPYAAAQMMVPSAEKENSRGEAIFKRWD